MLTIDLKQMIREVPDFPKPGINFFDITTLLKDPNGLQATIDSLASPYVGARVDVVVRTRKIGQPRVENQLGQLEVERSPPGATSRSSTGPITKTCSSLGCASS